MLNIKPYFTIGNFDIDMMTLIDHCKKLMSNNEVGEVVKDDLCE